MAMLEQNMSGVKLEKLRQKAKKATKMQFVIPLIVLNVLLIVALMLNRYFFTYLKEYGFGNPVTQGSFFSLIAQVMFALTVSGVVFCIYHIFVWKKAYEQFCINYKNKYVLQKIREVSNFSDVAYASTQGFTFDEIKKWYLLPLTNQYLFESQDECKGTYDQIQFHASCVTVCEPSQGGKSSAPVELFQGQVIAFSMFDEIKISESGIQIFSKKEQKKMKNQTMPLEIQTENEQFNHMFSVFAEDQHNAFYILTPQVMEDIMEFAKVVNDSIYIFFLGSDMYVACQQARNPFHPYIDVPVEEQSKTIVQAVEMIQKAKDILIHIKQQ